MGASCSKSGGKVELLKLLGKQETGRKLVGSRKHPRGIGDVEVDLAKYCILIPEILTWSLGKVFCTKDGEYPCGG